MRRYSFVIGVVLIALGLTGCNANGTSIQPTTNLVVSVTPIPQNTLETLTPTIEIAPTNSPTSTPESPATIPGAIGPDHYPPDVNPLTGLTVSDPAILNRRPMVVKVSNYPSIVRPQAGIGAADLVFEHYAEGGVTRFSAIFYTHAPERVGSIRSARLIDYELVPMYQGILAFSGASIGVEKRIFGSDYVAAYVENADEVAPTGFIPPSEFADRAYKGVLYGLPYFWRDERIVIPHNMFVNVAALWGLAAEEGHAQRPNLTGMAFHPDPPDGSTGSGLSVDVRYRATRVRWEYDASTGVYRRFADGQPHLDANTNEQVTAANVIVVYAGHYLTDIVESVFEGNVSWSIQITVWPEGEAIIFRDGQRYDGRWVRAVREDLMSFQTNDGAVFYLRPGNTWIQLMPTPEQLDPDVEWVRSA